MNISYSRTNNQSNVDKLLFWGELSVVIFTVSSFIGLNTAKIILYEDNKKNEFSQVIAFSFLTLFIMMAAVNIVLFRMFRKQSNMLDSELNYFYKEQCILTTVLVFFEFSYVFRFLYSEFLDNANLNEDSNLFAKWVLFDLTILVDGLSFAALLTFHYKNFKA